MKALRKTEAAEGLWLEDVPEPEYGINDVLIRILKTSICGTDVHIYNWDAWSQRTIPVPMVVGHEYFGVVEEVGAEVEAFRPGDRVSGEGHVTCGFCRNCRAGRRHLCRNTVGVGVNREGAFAEYLVIPAFNAFRIPDDISDDLAAIFDPFGNATHTALAVNLVGEDVLITGAGPIGIMAVGIAKHAGARFIVVTQAAASAHQDRLCRHPPDRMFRRPGRERGRDAPLRMRQAPSSRSRGIGCAATGASFALRRQSCRKAKQEPA